MDDLGVPLFLETPTYLFLNVAFPDCRWWYDTPSNVNHDIFQREEPLHCLVKVHGIVQNKGLHKPTHGDCAVYFHPGGPTIITKKLYGRKMTNSAWGQTEALPQYSLCQKFLIPNIPNRIHVWYIYIPTNLPSKHQPFM